MDATKSVYQRRQSHPILPDNFELSERRLVSQVNRLKKDPKLFRECDELIKKQIDMGIVEEVPENASCAPGNVRYLPHHPVIRRDKQTTMVRVVYNCSAKTNKTSLNSCLKAGPSLLPKIADVLIRFRFHEIGLVADVEKAFHQISIAEKDRDALRFLWIDNIASERPRVLLYRFARVVFGVTSSPFLLNATIAHHINSYVNDPDFITAFLSALYVDDFSGGAATTPLAYELYVKSRQRMFEGFSLRKWATNDPTLRAVIATHEQKSCPDEETSETAIAEDDQTYAASSLGTKLTDSDGKNRKVLGLQWNEGSDKLVFDMKNYADLFESIGIPWINCPRDDCNESVFPTVVQR